ncbi:hypothetical protein N7492_006360 [Penicillium capsulatum]|uniref:Uncharacterized protein n=1 Tax=Penicillium capsulatum TaxID=69766 RepID=A0A9W9I1A3_9EURO|nr:hypothetical protein N7492_006360 [Penicillium capsulatum]KAJ6109009.1 hypothetical protein N7512_008846 [Penicillium capsulatum]
MPSFLSRHSAHFEVTHSLWRNNIDLACNGNTIYHVETAQMTLRGPHLTFHAGQDFSAPVVGVCKFKHFSSDIELGIGNPSRPNSMRWDRLTHEGVFSIRYSFRVAFGGGSAETFTWKKASMGTGIAGNLTLVRERDQKVVAVFSSKSGFTRKSELDIYGESYGPQFEFMVVPTPSLFCFLLSQIASTKICLSPLALQRSYALAVRDTHEGPP